MKRVIAIAIFCLTQAICASSHGNLDSYEVAEIISYCQTNQPTDMRKSYYTLSGIVSNSMGLDPYNGDVYIFMNKSRNRIKLLHWEPGGLVIYSKLLEAGTFGNPSNIHYTGY